METVQIPAELAEKILRLANEFGEPFFSLLIGEGDGTINGVEEGRVCVLDAELQFVANYKTNETGLAERLKDLLNLIASEFSNHVPQEIRARAMKGL
jgi:hypothetical protein